MIEKHKPAGSPEENRQQLMEKLQEAENRDYSEDFLKWLEKADQDLFNKAFNQLARGVDAEKEKVESTLGEMDGLCSKYEKIDESSEWDWNKNETIKKNLQYYFPENYYPEGMLDYMKVHYTDDFYANSRRLSWLSAGWGGKDSADWFDNKRDNWVRDRLIIPGQDAYNRIDVKSEREKDRTVPNGSMTYREAMMKFENIRDVYNGDPDRENYQKLTDIVRDLDRLADLIGKPRVAPAPKPAPAAPVEKAPEVAAESLVGRFEIIKGQVRDWEKKFDEFRAKEKPADKDALQAEVFALYKEFSDIKGLYTDLQKDVDAKTQEYLDETGADEFTPVDHVGLVKNIEKYNGYMGELARKMQSELDTAKIDMDKYLEENHPDVSRPSAEDVTGTVPLTETPGAPEPEPSEFEVPEEEDIEFVTPAVPQDYSAPVDEVLVDDGAKMPSDSLSGAAPVAPVETVPAPEIGTPAGITEQGETLEVSEKSFEDTMADANKTLNDELGKLTSVLKPYDGKRKERKTQKRLGEEIGLISSKLGVALEKSKGDNPDIAGSLAAYNEAAKMIKDMDKTYREDPKVDLSREIKMALLGVVTEMDSQIEVVNKAAKS
ncbi:hypothetical protein KKC94_04325 [Patescibacteria group bacterium]|nr:hypothetical protein [Patescibacteria group bacterium]